MSKIEQMVENRKREAVDKDIVNKASYIARFLGNGRIRLDPFSEYIFEQKKFKIRDSFNGHYETIGKPKEDERYSLLEGKSSQIEIYYSNDNVFNWRPVPSFGFFAPGVLGNVISIYKPQKNWEQQLEKLYLRALSARKSLIRSLEKDILNEEIRRNKEYENSLRKNYGL